MKKICTVVGARPQFIKLAALSEVLRKEFHEILIHTGQHYDDNMSEVFFRELAIPHPDYNLGISGGTHGQMLGAMLPAVENVLMQEKPDMVLVYGDTNSTLAASLAAVKLHIPIAHVEAGIRIGLYMGPEEVNRVVTDRISQLLFCCTPTARENLIHEGIADQAYVTGDVMYDAFLHFSQMATHAELMTFEGTPVDCPNEYYYMTCHRPEHTANEGPLMEILSAMEELDAPVIFPVHPRTQKLACALKSKYHLNNVQMVQPVGYLTSVYLTSHAKRIVTDSGGLQREAFFAEVPCVTILNYNGWPETTVSNRNQLCAPEKSEILKKLSVVQTIYPNYQPFGDGHASEKITQHIVEYLGK